MLAERGAPFDSKDFLYEIKWDGVRCICYIREGEVRLRNRRGVDITRKYPELQKMKEMFSHPLILDGEICVFEDGVPRFSLIQQREAEWRKELEKFLPVNYIVFDILYYKKSLLHTPLIKRREILSSLPIKEPLIISEYIEEKGVAFFQKALSMGFEGVMAKRKESFYAPGARTKDWLKIKAEREADFIVCGYTKGKGEREALFGALVLGAYKKKGELVHVGDVGTGFEREQMEYLKKCMDGLITEKEHFPSLSKDIVWVKPQIVVSVRYLSKEGKLRLPVFLRIRKDKEPQECILNE
jgi:bifunctional non-homologous end joining protein LigD